MAFKKLIQSETLLKTIKECQDKRFLQPFDISKMIRVRYVTTQKPTYPYFPFRSNRNAGIPSQENNSQNTSNS